MPNFNSAPRDTYLTDVLISYQGGLNMIGERLMRRINVAGRTGYYFKMDKSKFRIEDNLRARRAKTNEVDYNMTRDAFGPLTDRGLKAFVDAEDIETHFNDEARARAAKTRMLAKKMQLSHEKEVADMLTDTAIMTNNTTLSGTSQFSDFANSDPYDVIRVAKESVKANGMIEPNTIAMGWQVWSMIQNHPDILGRVNVSSDRILTSDLFGTLFGFQNVLIGDAQHNSAKQGQSDSISYVWGKHIIVAYVNPDPEPMIEEITLGLTLQLEDGTYVDTYEEDDPKGTWVRANDYYDLEMVAPETGYLIKNAIA